MPKKGQMYLDNDGWVDYFSLCQELISTLNIKPVENDTSVRVLDKALWWYPKKLPFRH
jgi:hypothetical protein